MIVVGFDLGGAHIRYTCVHYACYAHISQVRKMWTNCRGAWKNRFCLIGEIVVERVHIVAHRVGCESSCRYLEVFIENVVVVICNGGVVRCGFIVID